MRGVDRSPFEDLTDRHAEHQEFREHVREIKDLIGAAGIGPVRRDRVWQELLPQALLGHIPGDVSDTAVTDVEAYPATPGGHDLRQHLTFVVEDAVRWR